MCAGLVTRMERVLDRLGEWVFASSDTAAQLDGWSLVGSSRWSRTYRDPRYDQFQQDRPVIGTIVAGEPVMVVVESGRCASCNGSGRDRDFPAVQWCIQCRGTGSAAPVWLVDEPSSFTASGGGQ